MNDYGKTMDQANRKKNWFARVLLVVIAIALTLSASPAEAAAVGNVVMTVQTVSNNAGTNNAILEVSLTNNGPGAITIGGFSFGISVGTTNLTFTGGSNGTTTAPYIFGSSGVLGSLVVQPPTLPGQTLYAEDIFSVIGSGTTINAGATVGLGHVVFNLNPATPTGPIT